MRAKGAHGRVRLSQVLVLAGAALTGIALAAGALAWFRAQAMEERNAGLEKTVLSRLDEDVPEGSSGYAGKTPSPASLATLEISGIEIAGRLEIPAIGLACPVAAAGTDPALLPAVSPERTESLAIAGKAYEGGGAFGSVDKLVPGESVIFQTVDGVRIEYTVADTGVTQEEFSDSYDLLLYFEDMTGARHWAGCSLPF